MCVRNQKTNKYKNSHYKYGKHALSDRLFYSLTLTPPLSHSLSVSVSRLLYGH